MGLIIGLDGRHGSSGGGGKDPVKKGDVTFIDYDGTILKSYSFEEAAALSSLPDNPEHSGLIAQGWNWTLQEIISAAQSHDTIVVGQLYTTDDGKTRIYLDIPGDDSFSIITSWSQTAANGVRINWGDGSEETTLDGTGEKNEVHIYEPGKYVLTFDVKSGTAKLGVRGGGGCVAFSNNEESYKQKIIKKAEIGNGITEFVSAYFRHSFISELSLPSTIEKVGQGFVHDCKFLKALVLPRIPTLPNDIARYDVALTAVSLPPTATAIGAYGFQSAGSLSVVGLGNVTTLGSNVFMGCNKFTGISSGKLTSITASNAFGECHGGGVLSLPVLSSITAGDQFINSEFEDIIISDNITTYPSNLFARCKHFDIYTVHKSVTSIPNSCFQYCSNLKRVILHNNITSIGTNSFGECLCLEAVILKASTPPTLANVNAFNNTNLCPIYVPAEALAAYKAATNWSSFKNRFRPWDYGESDYNVTPNCRLSNQGEIVTSEALYCTTDFFPVVDGHSYTYTGGAADYNMNLCVYNSSKQFLSYYNSNANPKTITLNVSGAAFCRFTCRYNLLSQASIYDNTTDELVWPTKKD